MVPVSRVIAIYARENGQGMAFPAPSATELPAEPPRSSPLSSVAAAGSPPEADPRVVQLVPPEGDVASDPPEPEPPKPGARRPALKRVK
jgi:stringent starvation protein B